MLRRSKHANKLLSLFLAFTLVIVQLLCLPISESVVEASETLSLSDAMAIKNLNNIGAYGGFTADQSMYLAEKLYTAIKNGDSEIELPTAKAIPFYDGVVNDLTRILNTVVYQNPCCMLATSVGVTYSNGDNYIHTITIKYCDTDDVVYSKARTNLLSTLKNVANEVNSHTSWNDVEKVLYLHNYMTDTYTYESSTTNNVYQFLTKGTGVCQDYTQVFNYLLTLTGITSVVINNGDGAHVWNAVQFDFGYEQKWFYIDVAYDDQGNGGNSFTYISGLTSYQYFLKTTDALADDVHGNPTNWFYYLNTPASELNANTDTFQNAPWNYDNLTSAIVPYGEDEWVFATKYKLGTGEWNIMIARTTIDDNLYAIATPISVNLSFTYNNASDHWHSTTSRAVYYANDEDKLNNILSPYLYVSVTTYGDTVFFSLPGKICAWDGASNTNYDVCYTLTDEEKNLFHGEKSGDTWGSEIYGIYISDDTLYYNLWLKYFDEAKSCYTGSNAIERSISVTTLLSALSNDSTTTTTTTTTPQTTTTTTTTTPQTTTSTTTTTMVTTTTRVTTMTAGDYCADPIIAVERESDRTIYTILETIISTSYTKRTVTAIVSVITRWNDGTFTHASSTTVYTEVLCGDISGDGNVGVSDVIAVQQAVSHLTTLSEEQEEQADLNDDGVVNVYDLVLLKREVMP